MDKTQFLTKGKNTRAGFKLWFS